MIALSYLRTINARTASAPTTNTLHAYTVAVPVTSTTGELGDLLPNPSSNIDDTTRVIVNGPSSGFVHIVKLLNIFNADTVDHTVTVEVIFSASVEATLWSGSVPAGATLTFTEAGQWGLSDVAAAEPPVSGGGTVLASLNDGRLSLHASDSAGEGTAAGTLYYHQHKGDTVALYDGADWSYLPIAATPLSIALSVGTIDTLHDVFAYDNAGVVALELVAWTNDSTRATAIVQQDGVWSKSGALTRRYLGSVYLNGSKQAKDVVQFRGLWNEDNPLRYYDYSPDFTNTWTNAGNGTWSQVNNFASQWQHDQVRGRARIPMTARSYIAGSGGHVNAIVRNNFNVISKFVSTVGFNISPYRQVVQAEFSEFAPAGWHYLAVLETTYDTGTATMYGDNAEQLGNGLALAQSGMFTEGER